MIPIRFWNSVSVWSFEKCLQWNHVISVTFIYIYFPFNFYSVEICFTLSTLYFNSPWMKYLPILLDCLIDMQACVWLSLASEVTMSDLRKGELYLPIMIHGKVQTVCISPEMPYITITKIQVARRWFIGNYKICRFVKSLQKMVWFTYDSQLSMYYYYISSGWMMTAFKWCCKFVVLVTEIHFGL